MQVTSHYASQLKEYKNGRTKGDRPAHFTYSSFNGASTVNLVWIPAAKLEFVANLKIGVEREQGCIAGGSVKPSTIYYILSGHVFILPWKKL